jgi:hypothetical protein
LAAALVTVAGLAVALISLGLERRGRPARAVACDI